MSKWCREVSPAETLDEEGLTNVRVRETVLADSVTAKSGSQNTRRYDNWIPRRIESQFVEQGRFHNLRVEVERRTIFISGTRDRLHKRYGEAAGGQEACN